MKKGSAPTGIQELGTDVLSTSGSTTNGSSSPNFERWLDYLRRFEFEGLGTTSFESVEGFSPEVEAVDYREGGFGYLNKSRLKDK